MKEENKNVNYNIILDGIEMPWCEDLERQIIGGMINMPEQAADALTELTAEDFYSNKYRTIFQVCKQIISMNGNICLPSILIELKNMGALDMVGGAEAIATMSGFIIPAPEASRYRYALREKRMHRDIIHCLFESLASAKHNDANVDALINDTMMKLEIICELSQTKKPESLGPVAKEYVDYVRQIQGGMITSGIDIGFPKLVKKIGLLQGGDLIILGGRTSQGKTQFAINIALNVASAGHPVGIFSLEMTRASIAARILTMRTGIPKVSMETKGSLTNEQLQNLGDAVQQLSLPIFIDETPSIRLQELKQKAKKLVRSKGVKLVIVDYLQLAMVDTNLSVREQEVALISRSLKMFAKELNVPLIALSQLSRNAEQGTRQVLGPQLSDLRESGAIEQDADIVMFVYHPIVHSWDEPVGEKVTEIIVAKNRNGQLGTVPMTFVESNITFIEKSSSEDTVPHSYQGEVVNF